MVARRIFIAFAWTVLLAALLTARALRAAEPDKNVAEQRVRNIAATPQSTTPKANSKPQDAPGLRRVSSRHLTLVTDLPPGEAVDALPGYFDQAIAQWCEYFGVGVAKTADWQPVGYLMKSRERFLAAGLLPQELADIKNGFAGPDRFWMLDQTSEYYRRHLLLHEGTHAFMLEFLGTTGPPWLAEGLAELLATHHLQEGKLTLNVFPAAREDVPKWGRIELVRKDVSEGHPLSLADVMAFEPSAHSDNRAYGWSWAAAALLDHDERYQERFRTLARSVGEGNSGDFNARLRRALANDWGQLQTAWRIYLDTLDYGYDFPRMRVEAITARPVLATGARVKVAVDRGWQSAGVRVQAGHRYHITAKGRYSVARQPREWPCEPGGVTLRYYRGHPLGMLLAGSDDDKDPAGFHLWPIGLDATIEPTHNGTLYFRINESPGSLNDNAGEVEVSVEEA